VTNANEESTDTRESDKVKEEVGAGEDMSHSGSESEESQEEDDVRESEDDESELLLEESDPKVELSNKEDEEPNQLDTRPPPTVKNDDVSITQDLSKPKKTVQEIDLTLSDEEEGFQEDDHDGDEVDAAEKNVKLEKDGETPPTPVPIGTTHAQLQALELEASEQHEGEFQPTCISSC
jgi:hypothetical protein